MSVGTTDSQEGEEEEGSHIGRAAVPAYLQGPLCRRCLQRHLHILAEPGQYPCGAIPAAGTPYPCGAIPAAGTPYPCGAIPAAGTPYPCGAIPADWGGAPPPCWNSISEHG